MNNTIYKLKYRDISDYLFFSDIKGSNTIKSTFDEIKSFNYYYNNIEFKNEDVVIDIGAHVGMVSIYLAKKFPYIKIYSFEPYDKTYDNLLFNIEKNSISNITPVNKAVTSNGRDLYMICNEEDNTGGATSNLKDMSLIGHRNITVKSVKLDEIFDTYSINKCKLLKIDCEGSEHEVLSTSNCLDKIDHLIGEFHINKHLENAGYSIEESIKLISNKINPNNIIVKRSRMAE